MDTERPLRISADIAIYLDGGVAKFRPPHRDPEKVFQAVLRWEEENEDHPRHSFVEEWIQSFELPEQLLSSLSLEADFRRAFSGAKSFRQMANILAEYKMKAGTPEPQARAEAASEIKQLIDVGRRQLRREPPSESLQ